METLPDVIFESDLFERFGGTLPGAEAEKYFRKVYRRNPGRTVALTVLIFGELLRRVINCARKIHAMTTLLFEIIVRTNLSNDETPIDFSEY